MQRWATLEKYNSIFCWEVKIEKRNMKPSRLEQCLVIEPVVNNTELILMQFWMIACKFFVFGQHVTSFVMYYC